MVVESDGASSGPTDTTRSRSAPHLDQGRSSVVLECELRDARQRGVADRAWPHDGMRLLPVQVTTTRYRYHIGYLLGWGALLMYSSTSTPSPNLTTKISETSLGSGVGSSFFTALFPSNTREIPMNVPKCYVRCELGTGRETRQFLFERGTC